MKEKMQSSKDKAPTNSDKDSHLYDKIHQLQEQYLQYKDINKGLLDQLEEQENTLR